MKFEIGGLFESLSRRAKFGVYITRITATLHEDIRKFMIMPLCIILIIVNILEKKVTEKITPDRQYMYNETPRRVRATIVAVEKQ
jgi:hypothetical protein